MQITYVTDKKGSDLPHHAKYILFNKKINMKDEQRKRMVVIKNGILKDEVLSASSIISCPF